MLIYFYEGVAAATSQRFPFDSSIYRRCKGETEAVSCDIC